MEQKPTLAAVRRDIMALSSDHRLAQRIRAMLFSATEHANRGSSNAAFALAEGAFDLGRKTIPERTVAGIKVASLLNEAKNLIADSKNATPSVRDEKLTLATENVALATKLADEHKIDVSAELAEIERLRASN